MSRTKLGVVVCMLGSAVAAASAQQPCAVNWNDYLGGSAACGASGAPLANDYGYGAAPGCSSGTPVAACPDMTVYSQAPAPVVWTASVGALLLDRFEQDSYTFSYNSANEDQQLVDAQDAELSWGPGFEVTLGRFDQCQNGGWLATYWQLFPDAESTVAHGSDVAPGFLDGIRNYDQVNYSGGGAGDDPGADDNVNAAMIHRLEKDWNVRNIEFSRVLTYCGDGCRVARLHTLAGIRYLQFDESLFFAADATDSMIDYDMDEYRIDVDTENQLLGLQIGGVAERCLTQKLTMLAGVKAGAMNNRSTLTYFEGGTAGAATINNGPFSGRMLRANETSDNLAFLGEVNVGLQYRVGCAWTLGAEYRVIGLSRVALASGQLYHDTRGINDVQEIDHNGSVILHGVVMRVQRCF